MLCQRAVRLPDIVVSSPRCINVAAFDSLFDSLQINGLPRSYDEESPRTLVENQTCACAILATAMGEGERFSKSCYSENVRDGIDAELASRVEALSQCVDRLMLTNLATGGLAVVAAFAKQWALLEIGVALLIFDLFRSARRSDHGSATKGSSSPHTLGTRG
jgi:hypothetical protein